MSLTQWLKTGSVKTRTPVTPGLPDPADCISTQDALIVQTANDAVDTVVSAPSRKRKRGDYINYDEETRAKIARYAVDNGVARASRKFTSDLGRKVSETTIRSMRDTYVKLKKKGAIFEIVVMFDLLIKLGINKPNCFIVLKIEFINKLLHKFQ
ncbi:unnamed protein product [Mytilus edulis]|uniref:Uncharacterized protein n=1 Tax=Mytilus edulis TaxID=6550 RepID=A0A8S3RYV4_MYTED|nr:unnamed protein product [Mytilus edulis]